MDHVDRIYVICCEFAAIRSLKLMLDNVCLWSMWGVYVWYPRMRPHDKLSQVELCQYLGILEYATFNNMPYYSSILARGLELEKRDNN